MFEQYWQKVLDRTPQLQSATKMRISVAAFKAELRKAFDAGAATNDPISGAADHVSDKVQILFDRIFGSKS